MKGRKVQSTNSSAEVSGFSAGLMILFLSSFVLNYVGVVAQNIPISCGVPPGFYSDISESNNVVDNYSDLILRQVHVFIRHGDRLPADSGPFSTYATCWPGDETVWNCTLNYDQVPDDTQDAHFNAPRLYRKEYNAGRNQFAGDCKVGQLTQLGYQQQVSNGEFLRQAYVDQIAFLNETLHLDEIWIRSDDIPRTVQSAHSLLLGLYPTDVDYNNVSAQAIPINTMDLQVDSIPTANVGLCPRLAEIIQDSYASPSYVQHTLNFTVPLMTLASQTLGFDVTDLGFLLDCSITHFCHGYPLPSNYTTELYQKLYAERIFQFNAVYSYPNSTYNSRFNVGFLLADFQNALLNFLGNPKAPKFNLWSSHDTTLAAIMTALQIWDQVWPSYATMLTFEIYEDYYDALFIRVLRNGNELQLPGCNYSSYCSLQDFMYILCLLYTSPSPRD
eukprot:TRINITY_DN9535_c0_g1_i3.p1 TRINITY_DN9535_c0_g1~~TRINITY_DN9535_c0_g1_i3.p1  ORF type:complete len:445 (-),score=50.48 TRINITY_DN9535_c0_g1_i3:22-1356(-)